MASKEENAWARSARKAYGMKQGATWDNMARNDAIKKFGLKIGRASCRERG